MLAILLCCLLIAQLYIVLKTVHTEIKTKTISANCYCFPEILLSNIINIYVGLCFFLGGGDA